MESFRNPYWTDIGLKGVWGWGAEKGSVKFNRSRLHLKQKRLLRFLKPFVASVDYMN